MQRITRHRTDRRLGIPGLCRWSVLLLMLAFAASGLLHVSDGAHAAGAAMHDLASVNDGFSAEDTCCHEADGQAHEPVCSTAGCSSCVPMDPAVLLVRPDADVAEAGPTGSHSGLIQPPRIRPPKLPATD